MPFIDVAYYSLEKEQIPEWTKFLQGYYDVAAVLPDSFDQAIQLDLRGEARLTRAMQERGVRLVTAVTASTSYMGFNMRDPVVGGDSERARLLRRAISIAVDFEEMIAIFINGRGLPAQGPIPPEIFGHRSGSEGINPYVYEWRAGRAVRRTLDEAQALMREAGYPGGRDATSGKPLTLFYEGYASGPSGRAVFDWYRKQFAKLGIQLVVRTTDYNRFQEKVRKGTAQIFSWGWNADFPDPENFLFLLYGPNGKVDSGGENAANYANAEFDRLYVEMRAMPNGHARQALIDRMVALARRDAPWLWGFHPLAYSLNHAWYGNAKPNLMARNTLKYKTIDSDLRERSRREWNRPLWQPVVAIVIVCALSALPAWRSYRARQRAQAR
jgi:ABC-type transport system substrate-binding protein